MVFVLDKHKKPLMPCSEKRARQLLERGRAVIHIRDPFTILMKDRTAQDFACQPLRVKLGPGSKTTGVAIILQGARGPKGLFFGEIVYKTHIKARLDARRGLRRGRRHRKTRDRKARLQNRQRKPGWLPPSLDARVNQTLHALGKLRHAAPITNLSVEHVRFDTQRL